MKPVSHMFSVSFKALMMIYTWWWRSLRYRSSMLLRFGPMYARRTGPVCVCGVDIPHFYTFFCCFHWCFPIFHGALLICMLNGIANNSTKQNPRKRNIIPVNLCATRRSSLWHRYIRRRDDDAVCVDLTFPLMVFVVCLRVRNQCVRTCTMQ